MSGWHHWLWSTYMRKRRQSNLAKSLTSSLWLDHTSFISCARLSSFCRVVHFFILKFSLVMSCDFSIMSLASGGQTLTGAPPFPPTFPSHIWFANLTDILCTCVVFVCLRIVEMLSPATSTVTATPRRLSTSQRSWLRPATPVQNSAYKPTLATPTSVDKQSSSLSVSGGRVDSSERPPTGSGSGSVWVHVGVGIAALVIVIVIGVLVSRLFISYPIISYHLLRRPSSVAHGRHSMQLVQNINK